MRPRQWPFERAPVKGKRRQVSMKYFVNVVQLKLYFIGTTPDLCRFFVGQSLFLCGWVGAGEETV